MKILLIWPRSPMLFMRKPLTFPILVELTPKKHSISITEGQKRDINFKKKYDVVGISTVTSNVHHAYEIADEFRERGVTVVLGGWHASALPEEAKQHADSVVVGEAEETWPQLLKDFEKGELKPYYFPKRPVAPELIPHFNNPYKKYTHVGIQATRGCPYGCEFCAITNMKFRKTFRMRPIKDVIKDIESIPGKSFDFQDTSLTINTEYTKKLFREMKNLNKRFYANGNINVLSKDDELLKLAKEAGCTRWFIGFESICQESINSAGKKTNKVEEYSSAIKKIHDHGMIIVGSFIFGFDNDTLEIFDKTDEFVYESGIDALAAHVLTPYPGTPIFNKFEKEGRILTKDWSKYDHETAVFQPKNMTPDELEYNVATLHKKWYNLQNNIRRVLNNSKLGFQPFKDTVIANIYFNFL